MIMLPDSATPFKEIAYIVLMHYKTDLFLVHSESGFPHLMKIIT